MQSQIKCQIKTPRRALGIEVALSNCTGKMGMDNCSCLNSSYFCFVAILRKEFMAHVRLQMNHPSPPIRDSTLLAGPPLHPSQCTYFMNNPYLVQMLLLRCIIYPMYSQSFPFSIKNPHQTFSPID